MSNEQRWLISTNMDFHHNVVPPHTLSLQYTIYLINNIMLIFSLDYTIYWINNFLLILYEYEIIMYQ
jgi:hypothetical protein